MTEALPDDDAKKGKKKKKVTLSSMEVIFDLNWPQLRSIDLNGPTLFLIEVIHPKKAIYCIQDSLYYFLLLLLLLLLFFHYLYIFSVSFLYFFISVNVYKHICFIISALYIYLFPKYFPYFHKEKIFFSKISLKN